MPMSLVVVLRVPPTRSFSTMAQAQSPSTASTPTISANSTDLAETARTPFAATLSSRMSSPPTASPSSPVSTATSVTPQPSPTRAQRASRTSARSIPAPHQETSQRRVLRAPATRASTPPLISQLTVKGREEKRTGDRLRFVGTRRGGVRGGTLEMLENVYAR
jgi:hypothetical protein